MPERYLSSNIIEAVAQDFLNDAVDLTEVHEVGTQYEIKGNTINVRELREDGSGSLVTNLSIATFVCEVTQALADIGEITMEEAAVENIARVCFVLGVLTTKELYDGQ